MSSIPPNQPHQPYPPQSSPPQPPYFYPPPPARSGGNGCLLAGSFLLNVVALIVIVVGCFGAVSWWGSKGSDNPLLLAEKHHSGKTDGDKVAIVRLEGVIMEGLLDYTYNQIEQAADDDAVKAIVLRIDSPGGSITASDDVWRRLKKLRDGDTLKGRAPKPIIVSMGSLAASGGYYVAMPGEFLFAERTTMTGSIGVYGSFPNIHELGNKYGFKMITIKQGEIKDSGSPFKEMSEKERTVWQSSINHAYNQFVDVVIEGRTRKGKLLLAHQPHERFDFEPIQVPGEPKLGEENLTRYIADGGIFTADKALELKLIDKIGTLDDAIAKARSVAGLPEDGRAVHYSRPKTLSEVLLGVEAEAPALLTKKQLHKGLVPKIWYLAPGCELAGVLAAMEE